MTRPPRLRPLRLGLLLALAAQPALAADRVTVRAGNHKDFGRLVLEWPSQPGCSLNQTGSTATLRCDRAASLRLPGPGATGGRIRRIETVSADPLVLRLTLAPGRTVSAGRDGRMVILDVADRGRPPTPGRPLPAAKPAESAAPKPAVAPPAAPSAMPEVGAIAHEAPAAAAAATETPAPVPAAPLPEAAAPAPEPALPGPPPAVSTEAAVTTAATIRLDPSALVAAAVFGRGGTLYLVVSRANVATAPLVEGVRAGEVRRYARKTVGAATVYTMPLPQGLYPHVNRDGQVWVVQLKTTPPLPGQAKPEVGSGSLTIPFPDAAAPVEFADPVVGDRLVAVPSLAGGTRIEQPGRLLQAEFLPAGQGLAIRPLDDSLSVGLAGDEVTLTAAGGLLLSDADDRAQAASAVPAVLELPGEAAHDTPETAAADAAPTRLFDLASWAKSPASDPIPGARQLMNAIIAAPKDQKPDAYLALARHFFASGFLPEARGALTRAGQLRPALLSTPEAIALSGAIDALLGKPDDALAALSTAAIADQPEAALWRGAARARKGDWPAAFADFKTGESLLPSYPRPLLEQIGLLAAEAALDAHDLKRAQPIIDRLARAPSGVRLGETALQYLRGEMAHQKGDTEDALAEWNKARIGRDALYRVKAELAAVDLGVKEKTVKLTDAIARMERLRFAWRGDALELAILGRLGEYQMQSGDYRAGWATMRGAANLYPATVQAEAMNKRIATSFAELFKDGGKQLNPVEAYGIYEEYKALAPTGPDGTAIIERLADRLVGIEAAGRAADLLEPLLSERSGDAKQALVARLASLRILDGAPDAAIALLDRTGDPAMTQDQIRTRRLLRARALADSGKPADALALIANETGGEAARLARDIAWTNKDWAAGARALETLTGTRPPALGLNDEQAKLVLDRAIALSLAGDKPALAALVEAFGPAMARSKQADNFRLVTRPQGPAGIASLKGLTADTASTSLFSDFLDGLKGGEAAKPAGE